MKNAKIVPISPGTDESAIIIRDSGQIKPSPVPIAKFESCCPRTPKQFNNPKFAPSSSDGITSDTIVYGTALMIKFPIPIGIVISR